MEDVVYTARGTPNIALIKYWGKRDEDLILPKNSSISLTLDGNAEAIVGKAFKLYTTTSVVFSHKINADFIYIDGELQDLGNKAVRDRFAIMDILRGIAKTNAHVMVVSKNSFPTASGLASSASGIATLAYIASNALDLKLSEKELSILARRGSGSACRSIMGGIVKWEKGETKDGSDSFARQLYRHDYWPELLDLIAIVSEDKKKVASRAGMAQTVATSDLYKKRLEIVDGYAVQLEKAIEKKDMDAMAEIIMKESNNMHAVMLDTSPPIMYLNDLSREIINAVHEINTASGKRICAYTFDAGPSPHIITTEHEKEKIVDRLLKVEGLQSLLSTKMGKGPEMLQESEALIDKSFAPMLK